MRGHDIRVIDYPIDFKEEKGMIHRRKVTKDYKKIHTDANIQVISPSILKIPFLVYPSMLFSHNREIHRQIKEYKPDIIIGFGIINTYLASRIAKKEKIPFIYYWIDVLHTLIPDKGFETIGEYLEKATIRNSTQVITINRKLEDFVKNLGAVKTDVIGAGIDLEKFNLDVDGSGIRRKYDIKDDDVLLFFMGFLYDFSGLKEVALEISKIKNKNIKLLVVGDGDAYIELNEIVKSKNLTDNIILTGAQPYNLIPKLVAASDVCILPAYPDEKIMQDIVPIKIYEYMAMSKPVICTRLPGIVMEFGKKNGIHYINNPSDIISKVNDINIIEEGKKARKLAEKNDWINITDKFEKFLMISKNEAFE
jgi:glycosyltransferase involved in cell wall biosynthesis